MLEEGRGPRVSRSRGPKDKDISNSDSNTSLTLKKVHLVLTNNALYQLINIMINVKFSNTKFEKYINGIFQF